MAALLSSLLKTLFSCKACQHLSFVLREVETPFSFSFQGNCGRHIPVSECCLPLDIREHGGRPWQQKLPEDGVGGTGMA